MRKTIFSVFLAVALLGLSACGGSDSTTTNTTTPDAASAKTANVNAKLMNTGWNLYAGIFQALNPGAQVIKTTQEFSYSCSGTYNSYSCTISDGQGGSCTATGSFSDNDTEFSAALDCTNFRPDSETTVDGSMSFDVTIDPDYLAMTTKTNCAAKAVTKTTDDQCTIEDDDTTFGENDMCEYTSNTCSSVGAFITLAFTVGPEGFTVTDNCGTYSFSPNYTMTSFWCKQPNVEIYDMTFDVQGTFNGETVDQTETITCDFTGL